MAADRIAELAEKFTPGEPAEYEYIPAIWQQSIAAGKRNDADEIVAILQIALPHDSEPLRDWQAVVVGGGVINGLTQASVWPRQRIAELLSDKPRLQRRWNKAIVAAAKMADDESVRTGTRYDALRMLGADSFQRRGDQLRKYLGRDVNAELQAGAVAGLADINSPAAAEALAAALDHLTPANRVAAVDGLLRSPARAALVKRLMADGVLSADAVSPAQAEKLRQLLQVAAERVPEAQKADGKRFKELFNGRDLEGWKGDENIWSVEDGVLTGQTRTNEDIRTNTFLIWQDGKVGNFTLRAVFRLEGDNNSGIQYRSRLKPETSPWTVVGYQADIHPAANYLGMLYEEGGRGIVAERGQKAVLSAEGKKEITPLPGEVAPVDLSEWTTLEVVAKGNRLIHKINGKKTVEIIDDDPQHATKRGVLALQVHAGPAMKIQYKSIKLSQPAKKTAGKEAAREPDAEE